MILIIVVFVVASEFALPYLVSQIVSQGMQQVIQSDQITTKVYSRPAIGMLAGKFDRVTIDAEQVKVEKLSFAGLHVDLSDVQLDIPLLLSQKKISMSQVGEITMSAVITEGELSGILSRSIKGIKDADVKITPGGVQTTGAFGLGFANVAVTLDGRIVGDGQKIKLITERFFLNNTPVGNIGGAVMTEIPLADLKKFPFGVSVSSISMEQGKVVIYADNRT